MAKRVGVDKWLFGIVLLLVLFGLVEVFSASAVMAKAQFDSPYPYMAKQAGWALLGMIALFVLMQIDYRHYNNPKIVFPVIAVTTVLLMGVFAMHDSHNTHRWIRFGGFFTFQPSELAKPAIILFLAYFLQTQVHRMDDWRTVARAAAAPLLFVALILKEPDLGTAIVCAAVLVLMLYLAGVNVKYVAIGMACAAPVLYYMLFHVAWRRARM